MDANGFMSEEEVQEWFSEWTTNPGIMKTLQEIENRRELTETVLRLAGHWQKESV